MRLKSKGKMEEWEQNPYRTGTGEHELWNLLVRNDFEGFLAKDWERVAGDYIENGFFGIDLGKSRLPENWKLSFPALESYKYAWIKDSHAFEKHPFDCDPREALYKCSRLEFFDFKGTSALVHKVFNGYIPLKQGGALELKWRSLFLVRKEEDRWRIAGFCGYMPEN